LAIRPDHTLSMDNPQLSAAQATEEKANLAKFASRDREQKRQDLVALLRGYFVCPVISALGEIGIADRMLAGTFSVADFETVGDVRILNALFRYLHGIGLVTSLGQDRYELTGVGRTAVARNGAFSLLASYSAYFDKLPAVISGQEKIPSVNRLRNVRGSGQLHSKKFFPAALSFLDSRPPTAFIDLGCGDGCFLEHVCQKWSGVKVFGVDLSEAAVRATKRRFQEALLPDLVAIAADAFDVHRWSSSISEELRTSSSVVISIWFVAHEFSGGVPERIVKFFSELNDNFPRAQIVLGEINNISSDVLADNHSLSIMPEYLLFHELSGQGVLRWSDWQEILETIPYRLEAERRFDSVRTRSGIEIPASFVWLLQPNSL
jgi:SAM-dependent methyltransferase